MVKCITKMAINEFRGPICELTILYIREKTTSDLGKSR